MNKLIKRGESALQALSNGHVTPQNVELLANYVRDSLKVLVVGLEVTEEGALKKLKEAEEAKKDWEESEKKITKKSTEEKKSVTKKK